MFLLIVDETYIAQVLHDLQYNSVKGEFLKFSKWAIKLLWHFYFWRNLAKSLKSVSKEVENGDFSRFS